MFAQEISSMRQKQLKFTFCMSASEYASMHDVHLSILLYTSRVDQSNKKIIFFHLIFTTICDAWHTISESIHISLYYVHRV